MCVSISLPKLPVCLRPPLMPACVADAYTIKVIGQDEFDDVKVPSAPATTPHKN